MNANPEGSYRFIKGTRFIAVILTIVLVNLACGFDFQTGEIDPGPLQEPAQPPSAPLPNDQPPAAPAAKSENSAPVVLGGWYGPACDEPEGTYVYRWSVDLMQDPGSGQIEGTVKFHKCPDGGRVLYHVVGKPQTDSVITLTGVKKDGGGALLGSAAENITFTFNRSSGQITPNLVP